ncbi:30S ribosomal protein S17 [Candidatus Pacearchaeota archaeon]|nr:30S ribosomal protein S17 [Candidatus Pacearchaeota archaeon]
MEKEKIVETKCNDKNCHIHGNLKVRGKAFEGKVTKKFHKRITIEFERIIYIRKYERYAKSKTKIHARLPICMENEINIGDLVKVQECRPLSKIIHFVVIKKIKDKDKK